MPAPNRVEAGRISRAHRRERGSSVNCSRHRAAWPYRDRLDDAGCRWRSTMRAVEAGRSHCGHSRLDDIECVAASTSEPALECIFSEAYADGPTSEIDPRSFSVAPVRCYVI